MKELQDIVAAYERLAHGGQPTAIATLVKVEGSSYRRPGARMLLTIDGCIAGSLSGGCLEQDVLEQAQDVMASGRPRLVDYDTSHDADILWGIGTGCKGRVQVFIEPLFHSSLIAFLSECLRANTPGVLVTLFQDDVQESDAAISAQLQLHPDDSITHTLSDASLVTQIMNEARSALTQKRSTNTQYASTLGRFEALIEVIQPPISLIICGAGYDAVPLAQFAKSLGWRVTLVDHRPAYATFARFPSADAVILADATALQDQITLSDRTAAVIMTHHYLHDLAYLKTLLPSSAQYIGLLGSRQRSQQILQALDWQIATASQQQRLYSPVGLDIGAETPDEIALSILAEIQTVFSNRAGGFLKHRSQPIHPQNVHGTYCWADSTGSWSIHPDGATETTAAVSRA